MLIRMRRLRLDVNKQKLVAVRKKYVREDEKRERKALSAAQIENTIQESLLRRLKEGNYGSIYNYPLKEYEEALEELEKVEEDVEVKFVGEEDEDDMEDLGEKVRKRRNSVSSEVSGISGISGVSEKVLKGYISNKKNKPTVEVEYEYDDVEQEQQLN